MMTKIWPPKDPDEVLDYTVDWTDRLTSETISTSNWTITGPDSALVNSNSSINNPRTIIWLSGGTLNKTYYILNRITTSGNRTMDQTVKLKIRSK